MSSFERETLGGDVLERLGELAGRLATVERLLLSAAEAYSTPYAAPALTLSTANAEGAAESVIRSDATILTFDATNPANISTTAATGSAAVAARRDHVHAHPAGLGANLHHAQSHVLATTAGLGGDHTTSGLTAGQVLRATGATTAAFQAIQASDLPIHASAHEAGGADQVSHDSLTGFVADEHIAHSGVTVGVSGLGLSGGGTIAANRTITLASSSNPGAAAAILASDANGRLELEGLGVGTPNAGLAMCVLDQASTTAGVPVLILDQADISEPIIKFVGCDWGIVPENWASLASVLVEFAGDTYRLALYSDGV